MISVSTTFQIDIPYILEQNFNFLDIGMNKSYFQEDKIRERVLFLANNCYLPANNHLLSLFDEYKDRFKISFVITGTALELLEMYAPQVIQSFKDLSDKGTVEFIATTYYDSLASIFSENEFKQQIKLHKEAIKSHFNQSPTIFQNCELIFNNDMSKIIEDMGFKGVITEGAKQILGWRTPNFIYMPTSSKKLKLLLNNELLTDSLKYTNDYSNNYIDYFSNEINAIIGKGEVLNINIDYHIYGIYKNSQTGIYNFLPLIIKEISKKKDFKFSTPSEICDNYQAMAKLDIPHTISAISKEKDISPWISNSMQEACLEFLYSMEKKCLKTNDSSIINTWRRLQNCENLLNICTKWPSDGLPFKLHSYASSPEMAYINFCNILNDLNTKI